MLERFVQELGTTCVVPLDWDESQIQVGAGGEVVALPARDAVERAYAVIGFTCRLVRESGDLREYLGQRGTEKLRFVLLSARSHEIRLEWRSGERPPIPGGAVDWHGRQWPAFFDEPCLYSQDRTFLIVEGRVPPTGFAACVARYREWATRSGLAGHRSYEPDLDGDVSFADREFVATVQNRNPYVTLSVEKRDPREVGE